MNLKGCALDTTEDWDAVRDAGLVLRPLGYGPPWNGWMTPIVEAREFARWISAWRANDPNGEWGQVRCFLDSQGRLTLLHDTGNPDTSDEWTAGENGVFLLTGWTFVQEPGE